jgi:hypothetical protein
MTDERESAAYHASAWMADLIKDIDHLGLLEGELRKAVADTIELFRTQGVGGNPEHWHVDLYDYYEDLHGHPPQPR